MNSIVRRSSSPASISPFAAASFRRAYVVLACVTLIIWLVASVMGIRSGRTVTSAYTNASHAWLAGGNMYESTGQGFLYLPHAAILYAPFALLPFAAEEMLWRLLNVGVLAWGVVRFSKLVPNLDARGFTQLAIVCLAMCVNCLRNGQATILMTGLMLLGVEAVAREKWNRAAAFLLFAVAVKPLAIVLALLVGALYRPMGLRLAVGAMLLAVAPFAAQHPTYVAGQYRAFAEMLTHANRLGSQDWWSQLFGMLRVIDVTFAPRTETLIRLAAAIGVLGLCALSRFRNSAGRTPIYLFAFTAVYLMLFNPRTENNTYCMLGPALGIFLVQEVARRHHLRSLLLAALVVGCTAGFEIGKHFTPVGARPVWLSPLCCTLFAVYLLRQLASDCLANRSVLRDDSTIVELPPRRAA